MCSFFQNKETGISIFKKLKKNFDGKFEVEVSDVLNKIKISPTNKVITVKRTSDNEYSIFESNWGIQFDKVKKSPLIYNSRIETIKEKKYWNNIFKRNRCLLPATGFFEWKEINKTKIPHLIRLKNEELFFIPSIFINMDGKEHTSMVTTEPNIFMKSIHNRMPVILETENSLKYLSGSPEEAMQYCIPYPECENMSVEIAEEILTEKQKKTIES
jgi:putative SOS response-associated peptidase YedK